MVVTKVWKAGQVGEPEFGADFTVARKAVLQNTDVCCNHNKYYAIEVHSAKVDKKEAFRVFTHYGRTDDLEATPDSGQKECRYCDSLAEAEGVYESIYRRKTGPGKGYREVALACSRIGSARARGTSSGEIDARTLEKLERGERARKRSDAPRASLNLSPGVRDLVQYVYSEATTALTSAVAARITAKGIETPLGILTLGQIEQGEAILARIHAELKSTSPRRRQALESLTGQFYTAIPHRIGRSRSAVAAAVIDDIAAYGQKQETLQLMKDMLQVNGEAGSILYDAQVDQQYRSLGCDISRLDPSSRDYQRIASQVAASQRRGGPILVRNIYSLRRPGEWEGFNAAIDNHRLLFHGSRIQNWMGILSRGILMPKVAVNLGVKRTDAGWLGNGIYFGDAACTSSFYTSAGRRRTRLMGLARVALGRMKDYTRITYGLTAPPGGFQSCHGVRGDKGVASEFTDDEFVVYSQDQQRLECLIEFEH